MRVGVYNPRVGVARSGGTETFLREMLKRVSPEHEVVLYTGAGELLDEIRNLDVAVRQFPFMVKEDERTHRLTNWTPVLPAEVESVSMYRSVRREDAFATMADEVDIVSTHYYLDNILVSRAVSEVSTVFHFPGIKHASVRWRLMARTAKPDLYLASSENTRRRTAEWLDIDVDGIVYPGVDVEQFTPDAEPAFESEAPVVMFIGRLDEGKGLLDLLEAFELLDGQAILYIVGNGTLEDDLVSKTRELGIVDSVKFPGAVPHEEIHRYFGSADVFCLPSYHEGFPLVNMEAMASGVPVVSTTIEAVEEQITDREHGLLVPPGDVSALSAALSKLLADKELRSRLGANGRRRAETKFTWGIQARNMIDYFAETVTES